MKSREQLIDSLVAQAAPVAEVPAIGRLVSQWLLPSALFVVLATHLLGPVRPGALGQLLGEPRFALEMTVGTLGVILLAIAAFRAAIPGRLQLRFMWFAGAVSLLWMSGFVIGLVYPVLEPSMLGKRDHCVFESFLLGMLPLLAALYAQRRMYALSPLRAAVLAGMAAGMLPALYMQIACMYEPVHILKFHVGPALLLAACAPLLLALLRRGTISSG